MAAKKIAPNTAKMRRVRSSALIIVVLVAIGAIQIAYYFSRLPATLVSHFNSHGMPNGWETKQAFLGFYALLLVLIPALYVFLPRLVLVLPTAMINMPNKGYWLAPERRAATSELLVDRLTIFGAATIALLICMFQLAIGANLQASSGFSTPLAWTLLAAYFAFAVAWVVALLAKFTRI